MTELTSIYLAIISGLATGMVIFLAAAGLTLVFGVLDVLNFAHGSLYMLGAYFTLFFLTVYPNFWVAVLIAAVGVSIVGAVIERALIQPLYGKDHVFQLLLTFALVLVIDNGVRIIWGTDFQSIPVPAPFDFPVELLGGVVPVYNLFLIVVGLVVAVALWLIFGRTRIGKVVRAASEDHDMTNALGINVSRVHTLVFLFGATLAAIGGGLSAPMRAITPTMGETIIINSFIIIVIGGLGSIPGALVAALLIGQVNSLAFLFAPKLQPIIPFVLMVVVIAFRPAGLFGEVEA